MRLLDTIFWFVLATLILRVDFPAGAATPAVESTPAPVLDPGTAGRLASLALACVHQKYPNKIAHVLQRDDDARPPASLTPAFCGCFDWHSAVHGHWLPAPLALRLRS